MITRERRRQSVVLAAIGAATMLAACSEDRRSTDDVPLLTAATLGQQTLRNTTEYLAQPRYAAADVGSGEQQALLCRACHSFEADGPALIGPGLHGMFGARAGSREDYDYSKALAESGLFWTPRALEAWLAAPSSFLPGNRMSFVGIADDRKRADLVAYLLRATASE